MKIDRVVGTEGKNLRIKVRLRGFGVFFSLFLHRFREDGHEILSENPRYGGQLVPVKRTNQGPFIFANEVDPESQRRLRQGGPEKVSAGSMGGSLLPSQ